MKKWIKLINEGVIDLPEDAVVDWDHYKRILVVTDVYGNTFSIPMTSILYYFNGDNEIKYLSGTDGVVTP